MVQIKACIFDLDGVIVDTAGYHFKAWQRLAGSLGIEIDEEHNEELKGVGRLDSLEKILSWGPLLLNDEKKIELMALKNKWFLRLVGEIKPSDMLPGVAVFLKELNKKNIRIGLGSSSQNSRMILEKLGIISLFEVIIDGTNIHFSKPDPEVFEKGAKAMGLNPSDCVVFEDAQLGVEAALNGGFRCIGVGENDLLKKATAVVPTLEGMTVSKMNELLS